MDGSISRSLRITFLVHAVITAILGLGLWLIPGRSLVFVGWVPASFQVPGTDITAPGTVFVDPVVTRLAGAAMLALAISSFLAWRNGRWREVSLVVELEVAFSILSILAMLSTMVLRPSTLNIASWVFLIYLIAFGVAWLVAFKRH